MDIQKLKFPIGHFNLPNEITREDLEKWIKDIKTFPSSVVQLTNNLDSKILNWKYRPNGWAAKQVIHHCADSHMNALIRVKLSLTEDSPTIRPYYEERWAELSDANTTQIEDSILLLTALHKKWVYLLKSLSNNELNRKFIHPEHRKKFSIKENIGNYAWHCQHHLAHIQLAIDSKGKYN